MRIRALRPTVGFVGGVVTAAGEEFGVDREKDSVGKIEEMDDGYSPWGEEPDPFERLVVVAVVVLRLASASARTFASRLLIGQARAFPRRISRATAASSCIL